MFVLVYRVCTHGGLGILEANISVYVCVGIEGVYTCKTQYLRNEPLCLCLCWLNFSVSYLFLFFLC